MRMKYRRFCHYAPSPANRSPPPRSLATLGYEIDEKLGRICLKPMGVFTDFSNLPLATSMILFQSDSIHIICMCYRIAMMENREMAICKMDNAMASTGMQIAPQVPRIGRSKGISVATAHSVGF